MRLSLAPQSEQSAMGLCADKTAGYEITARLVNALPFGMKISHLLFLIFLLAVNGRFLQAQTSQSDTLSSDSTAQMAARRIKQKSADLRSRLTPLLALHRAMKDGFKVGGLNDVHESDSGLKYVIHREGAGAVPVAGDTVLINYITSLVDATGIIDQSFQSGKSATVVVSRDQLMAGLYNAIRLLPRGTRATVFIPPHLAYGKLGIPGVVPPDAKVAAYIEVE